MPNSKASLRLIRYKGVVANYTQWGSATCGFHWTKDYRRKSTRKQERVVTLVFREGRQEKQKQFQKPGLATEQQTDRIIQC